MSTGACVVLVVMVQVTRVSDRDGQILSHSPGVTYIKVADWPHWTENAIAGDMGRVLSVR